MEPASTAAIYRSNINRPIHNIQKSATNEGPTSRDAGKSHFCDRPPAFDWYRRRPVGGERPAGGVGGHRHGNHL